MRYIQDIKIGTFRGIKNLSLSNLSDINILVGENNTRKTSVLEAVQLLQYPNDFKEVLKVIGLRDMIFGQRSTPIYDSFMEVFNRGQETQKSLRVSCRINNEYYSVDLIGEEKDVLRNPRQLSIMDSYSVQEMTDDITVKLFKGKSIYETTNQVITKDIIYNEVPSANSFEPKQEDKILDMRYVSSIDHMIQNFSIKRLIEIIEMDEKSQVVDLLKMFDNDIVGIELLPTKSGNRTTIQLRHSQYGLMPITSFGDGVRKVFTLVSAMASAKAGLLLIDEIETAIHKDALKDVFKWFVEACKRYNVQILATTHSFEALEALLENAEDDMITVYRLEKFEDEIISKRFSGKKAKKIIIENGGDLR